MSDIKQELDRIRDRISDPSFLANKGLSNEVGIHVFCYDPADELIVRDFVSRLKAENGTPYHIKECGEMTPQLFRDYVLAEFLLQALLVILRHLDNAVDVTVDVLLEHTLYFHAAFLQLQKVECPVVVSV